MGLLLARIGAAFYVAWGLFHVYVAWQIYRLALPEEGLVQGRLLQLSVYILTIALFAVAIAIWRNWRNDRTGFWLNLLVVGWADSIWVATVVAPGYVSAGRGLIPPAIYCVGAILTAMARHKRRRPNLR